MKPYLIILFVAIALIIIFVVVQLLVIKFNGSDVPTPDIPRGVQIAGSGKPITYAIMGDSTAISQGSKYSDGFAAASVAHLAKSFTVKSINTGISGATTEEIRKDQLDEALSLKPDIVLISAGANDTKNFVSLKTTKDSVQYIVDELKKVNPQVTIIVTASPALDSVTRFPDGAKQIMGWRTQQVNTVFKELISKNNLILAPIAEKTRDAFIADPTLTAADNFHPNARGYALWIPVINQAIDKAVDRLK